MFLYPKTLTVASKGGASETLPSVMGVYKITNITHSGRPVWQSIVRDRYLFYNGNNVINSLKNTIIFNISRLFVILDCK